MRIVELIYDDIDNPWLGGGGARRAYEVARRLAGRHHTTIITGGYPGAPRELERDGVRYLFTTPSNRYPTSRLLYMRDAPRLARQLPADLVMEVFSAYNPLFTPLWARRPTLAVLQNIYGGHAQAKHGLIGRIASLLERPALATYRNYLAVSRGVGGQLKRKVGLRGRQVAVIPNGIDDAFFGPIRPRSEWSGPQRYVAYIGRLDIYQKGIDTLLAALQRANLDMAEGERIHLLLAGGGQDEQEHRVRDLIAGYGLGEVVTQLGRVTPQRAAALMRDEGCRFVVMPSRYESWGMVAAESGAAGRAVLAFDISGLREAAPRHAHGLLLDPGSDEEQRVSALSDEEQRVSALSAGLTQLWRNPAQAAILGARGRDWARQYTWHQIAEAEQQYYLSLMR